MLRKKRIAFVTLMICGFVLVASWMVLPAAKGSPQDTQWPHFTDWSTPEPLTELNTPDQGEFTGSISRDGLSLYFSRLRSATDADIYVAHRPDSKANWSAPVRLPDGINTSLRDQFAVISPDGHWLYFTSDRPGGLGGTDIHVSYRADGYDDFAWETPINLVLLNTPLFEGASSLFEDPESGITQLYFHRNSSATLLLLDIFVSVLGPAGLEAPTPVAELNTPGYTDQNATVRRDGLEVYFSSNRPGGVGSLDTWVSTRASTKELWSPPQNVTVLNSAVQDQAPVLSWDGKTIYFTKGTSTGADIYVSHREIVKNCSGSSTCFRSPQYFLHNLQFLSNNAGNASVVIGGVNYNQPISVANHFGLIRSVLQGGPFLGLPPSTPPARLNQEFLAAQLSMALSGNTGSPAEYSILNAQLQCYDSLTFLQPVILSNEVKLTSFSTLGELFEQARLAIYENRIEDMDALATLFDLLNGNDPSGNCHQ